MVIADADKDETASISHSALYCIIRMTFELRSAPGTFQRTMEIIFFSVIWQFALVYFDNLTLFRKTPLQHINHESKVLSLLYGAGVNFKLFEGQFLYEHHCLHSSRKSSRAHGTRSSHDRSHPWTSATHQLHKSTLIPWIG